MASHNGGSSRSRLWRECARSLPRRRARSSNEFDNNFKYNSGQDIQPVFEGWSQNADGSFAMHFGYLNRN